MRKITIWIPGQPARVTHQSGTRYAGHGRTYKTKALRDWEDHLTDSLYEFKPDTPITGPVHLEVTWGFKANSKKQLYSYKLTKPDTDNLQKTLKDVFKPDTPITGPVHLEVTWGFKANSKKQLYSYKLTKPDTDNLQKTLKDVMTAIGFWVDDAQVVSEVCKKLWVNEPGIVIKISELPEKAEGCKWSTEQDQLSMDGQ